VTKAKVAASLLATTPGGIFIYYGEEIGMSQFATGDDVYRRSIMLWDASEAAGFNSTGQIWSDQSRWFPWDQDYQGWWDGYWQSLRAEGGHSVVEQQADTNSLWHHYKKLLEIRNSSLVLQDPDEIRYFPVDNMNVWLVQYMRGGSVTAVMINLDTEDSSEFVVPVAIQGGVVDKVSGKALVLEETFELDPGQTVIF